MELAIQFDYTWEFVHESGPASDVVKKLNQWRHMYNLIFISVKYESDKLHATVARKKNEK